MTDRVHLMPRGGITGRYESTCCHKTPFELLGDLITTSPELANCEKPMQRVELTIPCPFWMFSDTEARETFARAMWNEIMTRSGFVIADEPDITVQAHHARWDALNVTGSARLAEAGDSRLIPVPEPPALPPTLPQSSYSRPVNLNNPYVSEWMTTRYWIDDEADYYDDSWEHIDASSISWRPEVSDG